MKTHFTLSLLFVASMNLFAQVPSCNAPIPYAEEGHQILKNLDKSQVPTGILYEEVFPWADLELYDATSITDSSTFNHFFQSYAELYYSSYNRTNMIHPSNLESSISNFHSNKDYHHPIGFIDYNFNSLDPNAITNNSIYVSNGQLFDTPNRTQSPYLAKRTFISSVLQANSIEDFYDGIHYFYFQPSFTFSNRGTQISSYEYIDFYLDGAFLNRTYTNGNNSLTVAIDFPLYEGQSLLSFVYHKVSGEDEVARVQLNRKARKNLTGCNGGTQIPITGDSFDAGYGDGAYGAQGKGYIFWANQNCASKQLKKVVIFVDGFDHDNSRDAWKIWNSRINATIRDINGNDIQFGNELRSDEHGYDVIVYDYDEDLTNRGGGGLVENNGIAFVKFLETLYNQHQSTLQQDFIVIAPSMAALVVRYGLAWAEKNNKAHHVALYMSFDGPNQGAHVTAGIQQSIDIFTQYGGLRKYESKKNFLHHSFAAKQMLLNHSSQESESGAPHPFRQIFLNNLAAVGSYPQNLRKIAICDGNREGILKSTAIHGYEPCDPILQFRIKQRLRLFCANCNKLSIDTYAQTDDGRCESMKFKVHNEALLLKALAGANATQEFSRFSTPVFPSKSFDKAPGGMFGTEAEVKFDFWDSWKLVLGWAFTGGISIPKNLMPKSNFVPTYSSADYTFPNGENFNIYKGFQGVNLSKCAGTTPFDTVYALPLDFNHARLDAGLLEVFRNEIYNLKPKSVCSDPNCPEYLTLNSPVPNSERLLKKAQKAIFIEEGFKADGINESVVFKAAIGCNQVLGLLGIPKLNNAPNVVSSCSEDPLNWDSPSIVCAGNGTTAFTALVKNLDISTYTEFSTDGVSYTRANLFDRGFEVTLPNQSGSQIFFARTANNQSYIISGFISYCFN
jgi:hypothetical protein